MAPDLSLSSTCLTTAEPSRSSLWIELNCERAQGDPLVRPVRSTRRPTPRMSGWSTASPAGTPQDPSGANRISRADSYRWLGLASLAAIRFERPTRIASWPIGMFRIIFTGSGPDAPADRRAPGGISSSPWLYIQSEALQDVAFYLSRVRVHLAPLKPAGAKGSLASKGAQPPVGWAP